VARLHISVAQIGTPDWPRYVIRDNKGRYWTGTWWADSLRRALLYHREQEAVNEAMVMTDCIEPRRFVVTALLFVEHDESFTIEQFQELLDGSAVSLILPDDHDLDGVDIDIRIDSSGMEEIE
jgi:hypothetical protein